MSDAIHPRPDPAPVVKMFAALEIRRLAELIEAGDLSELGDNVGNYANVAAGWSAPPLAHDGEELRAAAAQYFRGSVLQVLAGDGPDMQCGWMANKEAREGIPPAYTRWIAGQVLEALDFDVPSYSRWAQCRRCGRAFPCRRSDARYCSDKCRMAAAWRSKSQRLEPVSVERFSRQGRML